MSELTSLITQPIKPVAQLTVPVTKSADIFQSFSKHLGQVLLDAKANTPNLSSLPTSGDLVQQNTRSQILLPNTIMGSNQASLGNTGATGENGANKRRSKRKK